uniref:Nucleolar protein 7 n=1 Tax=Anas platyrhynchos platyrhynchos TaxID=8840 RepID=U3IBP2_ANAPP
MHVESETWLMLLQRGKRVYRGLQLRGGSGVTNKRPLGKSCAASPGALPSVLPRRFRGGAGQPRAAMVRRRQEEEKEKEEEEEEVAAVPSPAASDGEDAPEELSFGAAAAAAESERQLAGEAARRHRELLKEKRRRRQELFVEQKRRKLLPEALLQELAAGRSKGNYTAMHLKDQSLTGLHQQTAKDFVYSHLYGPGTNRTTNEFFSLANKKDPVKKAAVQFVDKSWGLEKKQKATKFKKHWISRKM